MDFEHIKDELSSIVETCDAIPEQYQKIAFELMLQAAISEVRSRQARGGSSSSQSITRRDASSMGASKELRAFIARTGIEVNLVYELVDVDRNPPELRQYPKAQTKSQGQIQMALLSALLSLLSGGGLEVDASAVRETCRSLGYYDEANFAANFKKHSGLFTGPVKMGQPARRLSLEGERQLAQLVRDLVSEFGRGA